MHYNAWMIFEFSSYTGYLRNHLDTKKKARADYSLRAMALHLGVSPSTLSDVLSEKKNFSEQMAVAVANRLRLSSREARYFCTLVHYQTAKSEELKAILASQLRALNPRLREHFEITADRFNLISEWYHTAIMQMPYLKDFHMHDESVARALHISTAQAREALNLLLRLNLIEAMGNGRYQPTNKRYLIQSQIPHEALRKYHVRMLELAQESLTTQTPQEKFVGSETIPINIEDLPEVNEIIETCFQQIVQLSERTEHKNHIYHLGIQFFKLTKGLPS